MSGERGGAEVAAAVTSFVEWVATQKAYNGADRAGQELYDYGLNVVLPAWAAEWIGDQS